MIGSDEARELADQLLDMRVRPRIQAPLVLVDERMVESSREFLFFYDLSQQQEPQETTAAVPSSGMILVERDTGYTRFAATSRAWDDTSPPGRRALEFLPLEPFAPHGMFDSWPRRALKLDTVFGDEERRLVVQYLQSSPMLIPWMEYTRDLVGDKFGVPGGSSIASDGVYFWRLDAASYIAEYGIRVSDAALEHFRSCEWWSPTYPEQELVAMRECLLERIFVADAEPSGEP